MIILIIYIPRICNGIHLLSRCWKLNHFASHMPQLGIHVNIMSLYFVQNAQTPKQLKRKIVQETPLNGCAWVRQQNCEDKWGARNWFWATLASCLPSPIDANLKCSSVAPGPSILQMVTTSSTHLYLSAWQRRGRLVFRPGSSISHYFGNVTYSYSDI